MRSPRRRLRGRRLAGALRLLGDELAAVRAAPHLAQRRLARARPAPRLRRACGSAGSDTGSRCASGCCRRCCATCACRGRRADGRGPPHPCADRARGALLAGRAGFLERLGSTPPAPQLGTAAVRRCPARRDDRRSAPRASAPASPRRCPVHPDDHAERPRTSERPCRRELLRPAGCRLRDDPSRDASTGVGATGPHGSGAARASAGAGPPTPVDPCRRRAAAARTDSGRPGRAEPRLDDGRGAPLALEPRDAPVRLSRCPAVGATAPACRRTPELELERPSRFGPPRFGRLACRVRRPGVALRGESATARPVVGGRNATCIANAMTPAPIGAGVIFERTGGVLLSQGVYPQVPSARAGLTAVFGMGTGVSPPPWPPDHLSVSAALRELHSEHEHR